MNILDGFYKNFDQKVEGNLLRDSSTITKDVNAARELEIGEASYVRSFENTLTKTSNMIKTLITLRNELSKPSPSEDSIEEFIDAGKMIVDNKQYLIGASEGIIRDAQEVLRTQTDIIRIVGSFDPKLAQQSLLFVKDEKDLMALSQTCLTSAKSIVNEAEKIRRMDIDDFTPDKIQGSLKNCDEPIKLIVSNFGVLQTNSGKIHSDIIAATNEIKNITTESIELKAKFDYLIKVMAHGEQHDFKLAPEHQRIIDAERKRAS